MATGFVQRWKGKTLTQLLGLGSGGMTLYSVTGTPNIAPADIAGLAGAGTVTAYSTQGATISGNGVANISSTAAIIAMKLAQPIAGARKVLAFTSVSSGIQIVSTGGATFDGTNTVLATTQGAQINLLGLSTARWLITGIVPPSTTTFTFGTST